MFTFFLFLTYFHRIFFLSIFSVLVMVKLPYQRTKQNKNKNQETNLEFITDYLSSLYIKVK